MKLHSKVTLKDGMHFNGELDGFDIPLDAGEQFGGQGKGPKPKGLLLTGLAGCTAMDVISILRKMRSEPEDFSVEAESELTDEHPKVFKGYLVTYHIKGEKVTAEKAKKAVELSLESYCGVSKMLKEGAPLNYKIVLNGEEI